MNVLLMLTTITAALFVSSASAGTFANGILNIDGQQRTYVLFNPTTPKPSAPLVVLLHGHGYTASAALGLTKQIVPSSVWPTVAERGGFYVVAPQGTAGSDGKSGWNDCRADAANLPTTDDVRFVSVVVDKIVANYSIDAKRVYVVGASNGAMMALRLLIERPDRFAAGGVSMGAAAAKTECPGFSTARPIAFFNGTLDTAVKWDGTSGGAEGSTLSVQATVDLWRGLAGAFDAKNKNLPNIDKRDGTTVTRIAYSGPDRPEYVVLYKVVGGGHVEPSIAARIPADQVRRVGNQSHDMETAEEVWKFLRQWSQP